MGFTSILFLILYITASLIHLIGEWRQEFQITNSTYFLIAATVTKPFLVPFLLNYYIFSVEVINPFVLLALICGFIGDIALLIMKIKKTSIFFYIGLGSFLVGHLFYISLFFTFVDTTIIRSWFIVLILPFVFSGSVMQKILLANIKDIQKKVAIQLYIIALVILGTSASLFFNLNQILSSILIYLGAVFFAISDGINGYVRFVKKIKLSGVMIMGTYIIAQFLLIQGILLI